MEQKNKLLKRTIIINYINHDKFENENIKLNIFNINIIKYEKMITQSFLIYVMKLSIILILILFSSKSKSLKIDYDIQT
jgi:hypothetical protein